MTKWCILYLRGATLCFVSCFLMSGCSTENPPPEVSHIEVTPDFVRYDKLLFSLDSSQNVADFEALRSKYREFTDLYLHRILGLPREKDSLLHERLVSIAQASAVQALRDSIYERYDNIEPIREKFKQAFQYYKYYFPDFSVPNVYFCFTEFAVGTFLFEEEKNQDALGLSLDMFLGPNFPYELLAQRETSFSQYLVRTFTPEHLLRKALEVLIEDKTRRFQDERLLDYMIDRGRTLYIIKKLQPSMPDSILFEYSTQQIQWCQKNELAMWAHILDKELLYERKMKLISTMVAPAPSTMGMPPESPGRTADFLGFQIIDQYADETDASLQDLLVLPPAQEVLKVSRYKGRNLN